MLRIVTDLFRCYELVPEIPADMAALLDQLDQGHVAQQQQPDKEVW
jgi:hypothetical protein